MRLKALLTSAALLIALGVLLMPSAVGADKTAPVKTPLEVTYYFLPG